MVSIGTSSACSPSIVASWAWISWKLSVRSSCISRRGRRGTVCPDAGDEEGFFAAAAASGFRYQNPMSRYEQSPTSSQKMKSMRKLFAMTSPSITPMKSDISA